MKIRSSKTVTVATSGAPFTYLFTYLLAKIDGSVLVANGLVVDLLRAVTCSLGVTADHETYVR